MISHRSYFITALLVAVALALLVAATSLAPTSASAATPALTDEEQIGKSIFFDEHLSIQQDQACAACHAPEAGWTGPHSEINAAGSVYEGSIDGRFGDRKPPSSAYATQSPTLHVEIEDGEALFVGGNFWDGRATGEKLGNPAADQAQGPFLNPVEQALPDSACVVYRVCNPVAPEDYPVPFTHAACEIDWAATNVESACAQGETVALADEDRAISDEAYDAIGLLIADFEASPESNAFTSKYDAYLMGMAKLTGQERRGFELFLGQGQCVACHTLDGEEGPLFTDFTYDNLGIPKNPENPIYKVNPDFVDNGLGGFLATRADYAAYADENLGKQKVPTLRNVDLRPFKKFVKAYGHNGYFKTLEGIVHFYNTRDVLPVCPGDFTEAQALKAKCWPEPEVAANVNDSELGNLKLNRGEELAIVAFLKTLSDGYIVDGAVAATGLTAPDEQALFLPIMENW